jgi:DNA-binding MarR family transcriptional regulator
MARTPGRTKAAAPAWAGPGAPSPSDKITAVKVWMRVMTCNKLVQGHLRNRLRTNFDTTLPRFDILAQIDRAPRGPTMGELSQRLMVTKANITDLFGRLEAEGLVTRKSCKKDGRVQHVYLTPRGKSELDTMLNAHTAWLTQLMQRVPHDDLMALNDILGRLNETLKETNEGQ